jgi:polysaccharide biosynthesis/export protein
MINSLSHRHAVINKDALMNNKSAIKKAHFRVGPCMLLLALPLSGCGIASSVGPSRGAIVHTGSTADSAGIRVVDVTEGVSQQILASQGKNLFSETFGEVRPAGTIVSKGDVVEISLWEAPPAALFSGGGAAARLGIAVSSTSQATTLPEQRVDENGRINIPFAGTVEAAGRTTRQIEADIVRQLSGKAHQPQAIVRIVQNSTSTVTVVGEVRTNQLMSLTARGERVLDALAAAGGVGQPVNKITLQITRGPVVQSMPLDKVITDPKQNITLQKGDVVTAIFQPYSFTTFGATGRNEEIPFEASGITLSQALGRIGGLQDQRSDPRGVFIFRFEEPAALAINDTKGIATNADGKIPVIYRVDMKNPVTFFAAQNFPMKNKDIIYTSNAPLADIQKFVSIISAVVFPIVSVQTAINN